MNLKQKFRILEIMMKESASDAFYEVRTKEGDLLVLLNGGWGGGGKTPVGNGLRRFHMTKLSSQSILSVALKIILSSKIKLNSAYLSHFITNYSKHQ